MKNLIYIGSLAAIIYLQGCGDGKVKNKAAVEDQKPMELVTQKLVVPVPVSTDNLIIKDEKDLTGYWVGTAEHDGSEDGDHPDNKMPYYRFITISVDGISSDQVTGHMIVAGMIHFFSGKVEKDGPKYLFTAQTDGRDRFNAKLKLNVAEGDSVLSGSWKTTGKQNVMAYTNRLYKKAFHYSPAQELVPQLYTDYRKMKTITTKLDDGKTELATGVFTSTDDLFKYNTSSTLLTNEQAANLKKADIFLLRNSIFARHGYAFKKDQLSFYFMIEPWYVPISTDVNNELTAIEKKNIEILTRYEKNAEGSYREYSR